jgi:hypothetical protein
MRIVASPRLTLAIALVAAAAVTPFLPLARDHFAFSGFGFGTNVAQLLFWESWRAVATKTGDFVNTHERAVNLGWFLLAFALFALPALALHAVFRRKSPRARKVMTWSWLTIYLVLLFVWPQAKFGP